MLFKVQLKVVAVFDYVSKNCNTVFEKHRDRSEGLNNRRSDPHKRIFYLHDYVPYPPPPQAMEQEVQEHGSEDRVDVCGRDEFGHAGGEMQTHGARVELAVLEMGCGGRGE